MAFFVPRLAFCCCCVSSSSDIDGYCSATANRMGGRLRVDCCGCCLLIGRLFSMRVCEQERPLSRVCRSSDGCAAV